MSHIFALNATMFLANIDYNCNYIRMHTFVEFFWNETRKIFSKFLNWQWVLSDNYPFHRIWHGFTFWNSSIQWAVTFCWQTIKKISCSGCLHQAQRPWQIFYPSPPEETHLSPSYGMKVFMEWHESLSGQDYRIMPYPSGDFLVTPRRPNQSRLNHEIQPFVVDEIHFTHT